MTRQNYKHRKNFSHFQATHAYGQKTWLKSSKKNYYQCVNKIKPIHVRIFISKFSSSQPHIEFWSYVFSITPARVINNFNTRSHGEEKITLKFLFSHSVVWWLSWSKHVEKVYFYSSRALCQHWWTQNFGSCSVCI